MYLTWLAAVASFRDDGVDHSRNDGIDDSRDEGGEDGSSDNGEDGLRDNGEDGNHDDSVDGSRDARVSMWLFVAYIETETRQPLNYSSLVCRIQSPWSPTTYPWEHDLRTVPGHYSLCHRERLQLLHRCLSVYVGLTRDQS